MSSESVESLKGIPATVFISMALIFSLDVFLYRDIFVPILYLIPVALSAFSNRAGLITLTSIIAIILTTAGYDFSPAYSPVTQAAKRTLAIILLFLAPVFAASLRKTCSQANATGEQRTPISQPERRKHWARYN